MDLKAREQELRKAHKAVSEQIEELLNHRLEIKGALEENMFMQEELKTPPDKKD